MAKCRDNKLRGFASENERKLIMIYYYKSKASCPDEENNLSSRSFTDEVVFLAAEETSKTIRLGIKLVVKFCGDLGATMSVTGWVPRSQQKIHVHT